MANFVKLRVSLDREELGGLLEAGSDPHRSRQEFLNAAFAEERNFLNATGTHYGFYPIPVQDGYVAGFFKREKPVDLRHEDLTPYTAENYEMALVVLSVEKDQIAWVQDNKKVGSPKALLETFFSHLTAKTLINDWHAAVRYMDVKGEYFEVVRRHKAEIAYIKFSFLPPNALGADDTVADFVKAVTAEAHPQSLEHVYKARPGRMDPETPLMEASARIAMAGGGDAEVRDAGGKPLYRSAGARTIDTVEDNEMPTPESPGFVKRVIFRLFGARE